MLCWVFLGLFDLVLCPVHTMLLISLDCPFFIAPSVFSNVSFSRDCFKITTALMKEYDFLITLTVVIQ